MYICLREGGGVGIKRKQRARENKREKERGRERDEKRRIAFWHPQKRSLLLSSTASKGVGPHGDTNFGLPPD